MASWQARVAASLVRWRVKPALGDMRDIGKVRAVFNTALPPPRGARFEPATLGGVPGEWVTAANTPAASAHTSGADAGSPAATTLLYLHGGGFVGCSPLTHRPLTATLALHGLRLFVPDYRLAPEHPFPAALDDVLAVWRALRTAHDAAGGHGRLVVAGDSAGGNLALALMLRLRDAGERLPDAAALFSPATDLTGGSASIRANAERDAMFRGEALEHIAAAYLAGADAAHHHASPLLADLHGLPPLLVHVGTEECLRDDGLRLAAKARTAGVRVQVQLWPVVPHVWQLLWRLPEARQSVRIAVRFLREALPISPAQPEHHDVLIVGAGLSGIGAAVHLQNHCPDQHVTLLESRAAMGGTWDLFRYPGVRSDSDMYTLGYAFKPWADAKAIADGPAIRRYIEDTATERGIDHLVRYGHRLVAADWSAAEARWFVTVERVGKSGDESDAPPERVVMTCGFLHLCSGYYNYAQGYRPPFPGEENFRGTLVHPQFWPESLQWAGQRVVVIGSGATAVTLVPELAKTAAQVTMLQRSPTYVVARPAVDAQAEWLKQRLPAMWAYRLVRSKNILLSIVLFRLARRRPSQVKQRLIGLAQAQLAPGYDVATHFTPRYKPWDQRICLVPDGDLFAAIKAGRATVVTDQIAHFTATGITLASGRHLAADIIVTATGLQLNVPADVVYRVDGVAVNPTEAMIYKGMMVSGLPNLINTFGYTNASWTLKADLTAGYLCRLLRHLQRHGQAVATPRHDPAMPARPFLEFTSGYVQRAADQLPKQGARKPWRLYQNYLLDLLMLRFGRIDDGTLELTPAPTARPAPSLSSSP